MRKAMLCMAMLGMLLGTIAFPAASGAQSFLEGLEDLDEETSLTLEEDPDDSSAEDQYDSPEEDGSEEDPYDDTEDEYELDDSEETSLAEDQYDFDEETTDEETTDEETTDEETTSGTTGGFFGDETTLGDETTSEGETTFEEGTGDIGGEVTDTGGWFEDLFGGDSPDEDEIRSPDQISWPEVDPERPAPVVGDQIELTVIDRSVDITIVDIYDGIIVCQLEGGDTYEIRIYDLDGDGWMSYYECYVCLCGWFGYRYFDYYPNDVYNHIGDVYNINISNNYEQTGAIRPTPTERVTGLLPDTGGPALIGIAVGFAVVGAALIGRYSRRP